jgi:hypothetical protein
VNYLNTNPNNLQVFGIEVPPVFHQKILKKIPLN